MVDHNEAMRPNMNDRSEREFMGRMESNHAKLTEFSQVVGSFTQDYQRLYATYTSYREMLREVIAERDKLRESYSFDTRTLIEVCAERDQLREDVERMRADSVPLGAIRGVAVEAIRDVIGCPDVSNYGKRLSDTMEETAKHATYAAIAARTTHKETE